MNKLLITLCASSLVLSSYAGIFQSKEAQEDPKIAEREEKLAVSIKLHQLADLIKLHQEALKPLENDSLDLTQTTNMLNELTLLQKSENEILQCFVNSSHIPDTLAMNKIYTTQRSMLRKLLRQKQIPQEAERNILIFLETSAEEETLVKILDKNLDDAYWLANH